MSSDGRRLLGEDFLTGREGEEEVDAIGAMGAAGFASQGIGFGLGFEEVVGLSVRV